MVQEVVLIRPETCVAIRPESCVAIRPITRKKKCAGMTAIRPITPKFRGGNDFYKTNHSKIHEIRPITPKSDWSYNHPLL